MAGFIRTEPFKTHPHPRLPPCRGKELIAQTSNDARNLEMYRSCRRMRGFTMVEAVVAILLMGILAMAAIPMISGGVEAYQTTTSQLVTLSKLRYATERIARELREVRRVPATPTNYDITTVPGASVTFTKSDVAATQVTISTALPLVTLAYSTPAASATLSDQVSALAFRFLDINNTVTASAAQVAFVEITLALTVDGVAMQQRTRVSLRNLQ